MEDRVRHCIAHASKELGISGLPLNEASASFLEQKAKDLSHIKHFSLNNCDLTRVLIGPVCEAISAMREITALDLSHNNLGVGGAFSPKHGPGPQVAWPGIPGWTGR